MPRKPAWPADAPAEIPISQLSRADRAEFFSVADIPDREPDIPHAVAVIFGVTGGWSPAHESQIPGQCRLCGDLPARRCLDDDEFRSSLYCAGCQTSGYDDVALSILISMRGRGKLPVAPSEFGPGSPGPWEDESKPKHFGIPRERVRKARDGSKPRREPLWSERPPLD